MITLEAAIYWGLIIVMFALTLYSVYRGGYKAGRDETLDQWEKTEREALKSSHVLRKGNDLHIMTSGNKKVKSQKSKSGPYDHGEEYWGR